MKIWIVAADPFIEDFEEISRNWPKETEVFITTLTKYGLNLRAFLLFSFKYLLIKPDSILTDHGYPAFFMVKILSKLFNINTRIVFYLRGNWWLEEEGRNGTSY